MALGRPHSQTHPTCIGETAWLVDLRNKNPMEWNQKQVPALADFLSSSKPCQLKGNKNYSWLLHLAGSNQELTQRKAVGCRLNI